MIGRPVTAEQIREAFALACKMGGVFPFDPWEAVVQAAPVDLDIVRAREITPARRAVMADLVAAATDRAAFWLANDRRCGVPPDATPPLQRYLDL